MSSLPLLFKKEGLIEKHQVEGVDPSDRYFNRTVLVNRTPPATPPRSCMKP